MPRLWSSGDKHEVIVLVNIDPSAMDINSQPTNPRFGKLTPAYDTQKSPQHASIGSSSHRILSGSTLLSAINDGEGLPKAYFKEHSAFTEPRSSYRSFEEASLENGSWQISETDPENTTSLWKKVMSDRPVTRSMSKANESDQKTHDSGKKSTSSRNSPYNKDFDEKVLRPRGVQIELDTLPMKPYEHFQIAEPVASIDQQHYYHGIRNAPISTVWVETDETFITRVAREYTRMKNRGMCEAQFASYARVELLKQDKSFLDDPEVRTWKTERLDELVAKPGNYTHWHAPPLVEQPVSAEAMKSSNYSFDLRPDCSYWLSIRAFNPDYQSHIESLIHVIYEESTCPYFTIEFKKDNQHEERAISQIAAAASLALYNRFLLRQKRLHKQGQIWTQENTKVLRHYGLTMRGATYTVWCVKPTLAEFEWAGCKMTRIGHGYCNRVTDVRRLFQWINEIHCWGLTVHGPRCEKDIKLIMESQKTTTGFRPSDVKRDSEDDQEE